MRLLNPGALAFAFVIPSLLPLAAQCAPLAPGDVLFPVPTEANTGGNRVAAQSDDFFVPDSLYGFAYGHVFRNVPANPFGGLTFVYFIQNIGIGAEYHSIGRFTADGFAGFRVDASYETPTNDIAPASIDRQMSGNVIAWDFFPSGADDDTGFLAPATKTARLIVHTDAQTFHRDLGAGFIINGSVVRVNLPRPVVPEPSSAMLAFLCAATLFLVRRACN